MLQFWRLALGVGFSSGLMVGDTCNWCEAAGGIWNNHDLYDLVAVIDARL